MSDSSFRRAGVDGRDELSHDDFGADAAYPTSRSRYGQQRMRQEPRDSLFAHNLRREFDFFIFSPVTH